MYISIYISMVILITGSSSGIGKATAKLFQTKGWQVIATMRSPEKETELNLLPNIELVKLDVTDQRQIQEVMTKAIKKYKHIDVIVNNAGYGLIGPFEAATSEEIQKQYDTNVFGLMHVCQAILPHFREQKQGTIINVSSMGGRISLPFYSLYMSTKWAVEGFSESLQFELNAFGIRVKLIEPGAIATDFFGRSLITTDTTKIPAYRTLFEQANANMHTTQGSKAELVAQIIYKAATDKTTRLRYPVGKDARVLLFFKRFLPDKVWLYIVRNIIFR